MRNNNIKKIFILFLVIFMSIGFAVLTTNLNVGTYASFKENVWDLHFENLELFDCTSDNPTLSLNDNKDQISFTNTFDIPTDYIEFTFVVLNKGTIPAQLNQINTSLTTDQKKYIEYSLLYDYDDSEIKVGDIIYSGQGRRIKARFSYKYDIEEFSSFSNTTFTLGLKYIQPQSVNLSLWNYEFTGTEQVFYVPKTGTYKIEAWGASGGDAKQFAGGSGAYTKGEISVAKNSAIYINVGGKGSTTAGDYVEGGYNGGGGAWTSSTTDISGSGGGATSISLKSGTLNQLSSDSDRLKIIMVAGSGGGAYYYPSFSSSGGNAGGITGNSAPNDGNCGGGRVYVAGAKSSQTSPGTVNKCGSNNLTDNASFGLGGTALFNETWTKWTSGGGAGYFGGGCGYAHGSGGGSSYIGYTSLSNAEMYCFNCDENSDTLTKTVSTTNVSSTPTTRYAKIGNGHVKITFVS